MKKENIGNQLIDKFSNETFEKKLEQLKVFKNRINAKDRFKTFGIPLEKDEYWKFTNPSRFFSKNKSNHDGTCLNKQIKINLDFDYFLHFEDGNFISKKSSGMTCDEIEINTLKDELLSSNEWVNNFYSCFEEISHSPFKRPLAALNSGLASLGIVIKVPKNKEATIMLNYDNIKKGDDVLFHNLIEVKSNSKLTIIENGDIAERYNSVLEVNVEEGAELNHVRVQGNNKECTSLTHFFANLCENSILNTCSINLGSLNSRNEYFKKISGEHSKLSISGACLGITENSIQDNTIFISHDEKECESRQIFKKVLANESTGVFQGKILVKDKAQKTDGYQISKGLLLDKKSKFLAKPELEIYADDVVCSHGSTCGNVDEETLFYLTSRGIDKKKAIEMVVLAFLDEALSEIKNEKVLNEIRQIIEKNLEL